MQIDRRPLLDRPAVFPRLGLANLPTPLEPDPKRRVVFGERRRDPESAFPLRLRLN